MPAKSPPRRYADFLPDAQGLARSRPSPIAGVLIVTVALLFGALVGFSAWAEVEQIVRATGQVAPASRVRHLNHPRGGRVAAIHVRDGQRVRAGDVLLVFDPELRAAELAELRARFQQRGIEAARLQAEADGRAFTVADTLAEERPDLVEEQRALLEARLAAQASRAEQLERAVERREREMRTLAAEVARLRNGLALLRQQQDAVRELAEKGLYPRLRVVAIERQVSDTSGELAKASEGLEAARAALEEAKSQLAGLEQEWRSRALAELAEANAERERLVEAIRHQEAQLRGLVLQAPVDGIVEDLSIASLGQSVGANETLMKLVPVGEGLVIEARVANEDIGDIHEGQGAVIKVRAFDFLQHGTLSGRVVHRAVDATPDPGTGRLAYSVTVHTERTRLGSDANERAVVPGMVVDVEFLVGERTILSYLTDRILRLREEVFREG